MAIEYKIPITTVSGGNVVPVTRGYYQLRKAPFNASAYAGTHVSNGIWNFGAVANGQYQLFYSSNDTTYAQVANFGERWIGGEYNSANTVTVFTGADTVANRAYPTLATAIDSFTSPADTNRCEVEIEGTGASSQYITLAHSDLVAYVNIRGKGKHINLILGTTGDSASVNIVVTFSNLSIWMGSVIATDRSYINCTFDNCDIYVTENITFEDCNLHNCRIFQLSGYDTTISKSTIMTNCILVQALKTSSITGNGFYSNVQYNVLTTYTFSDPTTP